MHTQKHNNNAARVAGQKSKLTFTIRKNGDRRYQHLEIVIMEPKEWSTHGKSALLAVKWQSDSDDWGKWYAAKAECAPDCNVRDIGAVMSRAAKLAGKLFPDGSESPEALLAELAKLGIQRVAYDSRISKYVTEQECQDVSFKRYMNDYTRDGGEGCTVAVLAPDAASAVPLMIKVFAERISGQWSSEHYAKRFAEWMAAGQPVKLDTYSNPPSFPSLPELLNSKEASGLAA